MSCIPNGEYLCEIDNSPKYGKVYHVRNVPGQDHILIHWGNFAGNNEEGHKSNTDGCIILGLGVGTIDGVKAVTSSKVAFDLFMKLMNREPFMLEIIGEPWKKSKAEELS